jgi:hypothetical protein
MWSVYILVLMRRQEKEQQLTNNKVYKMISLVTAVYALLVIHYAICYNRDHFIVQSNY